GGVDRPGRRPVPGAGGLRHAGSPALVHLGRVPHHGDDRRSGTLVGPIIGGAFFIVLQEKVSSYVQWYSIVVGLVLVFIVLFVPRGLLGFRSALRLHGLRRGST
ncbi:MAG: hypothetical protein ACREKB_13285, partial [Candidatus Rokuibacteriota bacterium]